MAVSTLLDDVRIASIGSLNVDLIAFCNHFPSPGETLIGNAFEMGPGGKGANQCACAALLSAPSTTTPNIPLQRVAMIGAVGDDLFGSNYLKSFQNSNVIIDLVEIIPNTSTGVAPITVDSKGENSIIVVPGANNKMTIIDKLSKLDKLLNLKCALFQLEIPKEVTLACIKKCYERGIITFFTPEPVPPDGLLDDFFKYSSIVIPNLIEAIQLSRGNKKEDLKLTIFYSFVLLQKNTQFFFLTILINSKEYLLKPKMLMKLYQILLQLVSITL